MSSQLTLLKNRFISLKNNEKAKLLSGFFKTGKGQYGEGDLFLGITVPEQRKLVKEFCDISLSDTQDLILSKYHEYRLTALLILVKKYEKGDENLKKEIYEFYIKNTKSINNWDLVDLSAPNIVGKYLFNRKNERKILYKLVKSNNIWERRIAVLACFTFIRAGDFDDILKISELLLLDKHDLIHKAVGWMLRELGKVNIKVEEEFLEKHYKFMPRTMLRYAIEKFEEGKRKSFLFKKTHES